MISYRKFWYFGKYVLIIRLNKLFWNIWYPAGVELMNHHPQGCECKNC